MIQYVRGRAELPLDYDKLTVIAHVCNNSRKWGAGFTSSIDEVFPEIGSQFVAKQRNLGSVNIVKLPDYNWAYAQMVAMNGVRSINNPNPLDMDALRECLIKLNVWAIENEHVIQMPMIGSGLANGNWDDISRLIDETIDELVTVVTL
jgi:O-acetyl-ADP-ribose deacetylase (regulator of RNase III)